MSITKKAVATAVNGLEYARFGGLRTDDTHSPYEVIAHEPAYRLRRYYPDVPAGAREPVLLVPPLMLRAEVWDVAPQTSAVSVLHDHAVDPWVVDFGDPEREPGGAERDVTDHVLAVADAIERVRDATGRAVHIGGYSQGGLFCYQAAAYRGCDGIASVFALGSPLDSVDISFLPDELLWKLVRFEAGLLRQTGLPGWLVRRLFKWSNPTRALRSEIDYVLALHDREALLPRERQRRFLGGEGWVGWSGPALAEAMQQLSEARYMNGGLVLGDRAAGFADVTCPVLAVIGEVDEFGPARQVRSIVQAAPRAEVYETTLPVGHFGLANGSHAIKRGWPTIAAWIHWVAGQGAVPEHVRRLTDAGEAPNGKRGLAANVTYGLGLAAGTGLDVPRTVASTSKQAAETVRELSRETIAQLPRLVRLERMGPQTRISYGSLLADAAKRDSDGVSLLFEDRAHTHAAVGQRIDNVVRGLIAVGVRKGEHVGVLMHARPSALATVAALNRLGAVAVLLRPDGDMAREAELGQIARVVADPEHAAGAAALDADVFVLGGGAGRRKLPAGAVDMERIDPDAVELPKWYRPNPGRARDLAFILFTGTGERTRADRISNGRWARSALGAASAAKLTAADTVYSVNPLHHPSGLLLATAAPAAAGARLAMTNRFDPDAFWSEVRRYGATVVPYTWTMLRDLVNAEPHPAERHHPIRLFVGSGMPANLWRRTLERFAPARVLELYASTRSGAILGNVSGRKVGALGRPLPGTPRVKIAAWDDGLEIGEDGYAIEADTGMLLVEARDADNDVPLRGVFAPDDAWIATGDLFRRDADGDLWLADPSRLVEDALGELDAVDLAVCHDSFAAVTLREGHTLTKAAIRRALKSLDPDVRPADVSILDEMPVTSWFRPSQDDLTKTKHEGEPDNVR